MGGAYCPQNQPRAAEPPERSRPTVHVAACTTCDDDDELTRSDTALDRLVARWPVPARVALVAAVLVLGAVAMVTAGAGVGVILTLGR